MKMILDLWTGVSGALSGEGGGSRKLEVAMLAAILAVSYPEAATGIGILAAGYCIGQGAVDAKSAG